MQFKKEFSFYSLILVIAFIGLSLGCSESDEESLPTFKPNVEIIEPTVVQPSVPTPKLVRFEIEENIALNAFYIEITDKTGSYVAYGESVVFLHNALPPIRGTVKLNRDVTARMAADYASRGIAVMFQNMMKNYQLTLTIYIDGESAGVRRGRKGDGGVDLTVEW